MIHQRLYFSALFFFISFIDFARFWMESFCKSALLILAFLEALFFTLLFFCYAKMIFAMILSLKLYQYLWYCSTWSKIRLLNSSSSLIWPLNLNLSFKTLALSRKWLVKFNFNLVFYSYALLYESTIHSPLEYCFYVWAGAAKCYLNIGFKPNLGLLFFKWSS